MRPLRGLLVLLLAILGLSVKAGELDTLARISTQIEQHPLVRAEFTQSKRMTALKRPLVTSGHLVFSRQQGVLWQIEKPFRMSYVLSEERIVEIAADGTRRERSVRDLPGLAQIGRVFRALLSADTAALREVFEISVHGEPAKWDIELKPRQAQLAQFMSGLQLSGGRFVESIRIDEASGDTTQIVLRNTQGASAPSELETQLFGGVSGGQ